MKLSFLIILTFTVSITTYAGNQSLKDSVTMLDDIVVMAKTPSDRLREGSYSATAIDVSGRLSTSSDIVGILDKASGVRVRREGGLGSDFNLMVNGMSGNAIKYFIDGIPMESMGNGMTVGSLPAALIERIEIYKGVIPAWLGGDILGGAVNVVTRPDKRNYIDATLSIGSFHTFGTNINGRWAAKPGAPIIKAAFSLSKSKNDYLMKDVEVWDEDSRKYVRVNRRRFHDDYLLATALLEIGVENKSWTDAFYISGNCSMQNKQLQTGSVQSKVYGDASRHGHSFGFGVNYRKRDFLTEHLDTRITFNQSFDHSVTTDTAMRKYDWNGHYIYSPRNEITGRGASIRHYRRPSSVATAVLDYLCHENHRLTLNYLFNLTGNRRTDDVDPEFEPSSDNVSKHVASLSLTSLWASGKFGTSLFFKNYVTSYHIYQNDIPSVTGSSAMAGRTVRYYPGYGMSSRLEVMQRYLGLKFSAENSVRLPSSVEILGNGSTIYANVALKPERSLNFNLGCFGETQENNAGAFSYEVNGFIRLAKDYIRASVSEKEGMMQYTNEPSVHIFGFEGQINYSWRNRMFISANYSWMDSRDRRRLLADGNVSATFNNRVPNRPWTFGHLEAGYIFHGFPASGCRLRIKAGYDYVHWFFLTWEAYGYKESKARIPTQNIVNADISCSWHEDRYSIALECTNIFDETAYDSYRLQKPGRAFTLTFRLSLK